jgi:hypothetical protein
LFIVIIGYAIDRNFLDEISYEIVDWLRNEESKYQADLLAREVQSYVHQPTSLPNAALTEGAAGGKKEKGATGKSPANRIFLIQLSK